MARLVDKKERRGDANLFDTENLADNCDDQTFRASGLKPAM